MKKLFFSMLLSAVIGLGVPALDAEAAQMGSESMMMEMDTLFHATADEIFEFPATEFNADKVTVISEAYTIDGKTHMLIKADKTFTEYMLVYDEEGNQVQGTISSVRSDKEVAIKFSMDAFTGSKAYTLVFYDYNRRKVAVKKIMVTAVDWQGSFSRSWDSIYTIDEALYCTVYLPATIDTSDIEICLYDGDTVIGYFLPKGVWKDSSSLDMTSLVFHAYNPYHVSLNNSIVKNNTGSIYFLRKVEVGKSYVLKAKSGNNIYDMGDFYVDGAAFVSYVGSTDNEISSTNPVVKIEACGYNIKDLLIQIRDPESKEVLATSEGGKYFLYGNYYGKCVLNTDETRADLEGGEIVVSYQGDDIYYGSYNNYYPAVVKAYYNHADNVVVVKTVDIPDGTLLKAVIDDIYMAEAVVKNNNAILQFEIDGVDCALPASYYNVEFSYIYMGQKYMGQKFTGHKLIEVMGIEEKGENQYNINVLDNRYFDIDQNFSIKITISENHLNAKSGDFKVKLLTSDGRVINDIALTATSEMVDGVEVYTLEGTVPATTAGKYSLYLYRGEILEGFYSLYVMDADTVYASAYYTTYEDDKVGIVFWMPQTMKGYDKSKFVAKVTDIMGNDIGVKANLVDITDDDSIKFELKNVPGDVISVKVSFTYDDKPIMNIDNIPDEVELDLAVPTKESEEYSVKITTINNDQGYSLATAFGPKVDSVAYVVETYTLNVLKTWKIPRDGTYLTKEMLDGLSYNNAGTMYDIYFVAEDGSGYSCSSNIYLGYQEQTEEMEPTPNPDLSGLFATSADGNFVKDGTEVRCYNLDGTPVINEFKCDGTYTYYFQADGTAMRDRLTYHPDGVHVIYFDENGHEVFSNFANVKKTIAGLDVDDYCFFDVYGYLYVDVVTYDQTGTYLYYANPYGVMDRGKWFEFSESVKWADGTPFDKAGGKYGYANEDGTLMINQWTYDWEGRQCYMQGNGVALYP